MDFKQTRRQQFLFESAYKISTEFFEDISAPGYLRSLAAPFATKEDLASVSWAYADGVMNDLMLRYTAGVPLDRLRNDIERVVRAHEVSGKHHDAYYTNFAATPLGYTEIDEYERVMQIIGLCYLLHRTDLLQRVADMLDPLFRCRDTLYEDLLAYELEGRFDIDHLIHKRPYERLVDSLYCDTEAEAATCIAQYLDQWYPAMSGAIWHDSHIGMDSEGCGAYFGYWAVEAAAVVYLLDLDDTRFRGHFAYPADLVDYARAMVAPEG